MTEPSSFGADPDSFSEEQESISSKTSFFVTVASSSTSVLNSTSSNDSSLVDYLPNVYTGSVIEEELLKQSSSAKRKSEENEVLRLIKYKRKHLEKTLSAAQRDLLLQEAKDDAQFRKTLPETLQESNRVFAESLHGISHSITDLRNNFCRSMQM